MTVRIGLAQHHVEPGDVAGNLARATAMVGDAAGHGAAVVVLPECLDAGWTHPAARDLARPVPGPTTDALAAAARAHGVHVVAGVTERAGDRLHNTAVLLGPDGALLHTHRKVGELDIGRALYTTGDTLAVAQTPFGRTATPVCADLGPDALAVGHSLALLGARLLLSPCAWAVPPEHDDAVSPYGEPWLSTYPELARTHGVAVVGVSNVGPVVGGPWDGWRCIGRSLAVGPDGAVLAHLPYGEEALAVVDVPVAGTAAEPAQS